MSSKRVVSVGKVYVGGSNKVSVQSMTQFPASAVDDNISQIKQMEYAGVDIVRITIPDEESAKAISRIKKEVSVPIVADIHFDYRLALLSIEHGADKLRLNPGNIRNPSHVRDIAKAAMERGIPIRVGVNTGSLPRDIVADYKNISREIVESALREVEMLEDTGFRDIVISVKSTDVIVTISGYRLMSKLVDYPLHLGVTEAGGFLQGTVKSAIGIGGLLLNGIGDTIRISLTDDPVREVVVGIEILKSVGLREGVEIISCPTCGRQEIDVISIVEKLSFLTSAVRDRLKIAVMGCAVNGPGEAEKADIGIVGSSGKGVIYYRGKIIKMIDAAKAGEWFLSFVKDILDRRDRYES
ncbi:MAG: flavodoxin-dependent (E)-4-hydroxy-3-methylbut-2-enyl-diphosphate synthase [Synergistetes bacterium]|nr:flavodoxin-dependent (E)-4-hydroxy-3-methylbut-2-enyl-diphosphate synthase [Synergistota bacterium]